MNQVSLWVNGIVRTTGQTTAGLIEQLIRTYDDPEAKERATRKLSIMRQGTRTFGTFLAEFDRTLADVKGTGWVDQVKCTFLRNGLHTELLQVLVATPMLNDYRNFCKILHNMSNNLDALKTT